jgi:hypothetical protein
MASAQENQRPLIVTGMHRSGTSLAASILHAAGAHMGDDLAPANRWNKRGYYEDVDFLEFHRTILRAAGLSDRGWTLQCPITVATDLVEQARALSSLKCAYGRTWGWKDPRTTLFLDLWHELFPDAQFVFVFRFPWLVIDSLFRRRTDSEILARPATAIEFWLHYNHILCDFIERYPRQCLLVAVNPIARDPSRLIAAVNEQFGRALSPHVQACSDLRLLHQDACTWRAMLISKWAPEARILYERLNTLALLAGAPWPDDNHFNTDVCKNLFYDEWNCLRNGERALRRLKREMARPGG